MGPLGGDSLQLLYYLRRLYLLPLILLPVIKPFIGMLYVHPSPSISLKIIQQFLFFSFFGTCSNRLLQMEKKILRIVL